MKTLVVYSSRTGNTALLARFAAEGLGPGTVLAPVEEAPEPDGFDLIAFGFGVYHGWPDGDMRAYMRQAKPRFAGIFLTLGAWPDSEHAAHCLGRAEGLLASSQILVQSAFHGRIAPDLVERMKQRPAGTSHGWDAERARRVAAAAGHPDAEDCRRVRELFAAARKRAETSCHTTAAAGQEAVLAVWFGSSFPSAEDAYDRMEHALREVCPALPLRRAYLSRCVRRKIGWSVPSPPVALQRFRLAGIRSIRVLAGILSDGEEYRRLLSDLEAFRIPATGFDAIRVTRPPLDSPERLRRFIRAVTETEKGGEPVLFMGHGHPDGRSDFAYLTAARELERQRPETFLGCVEGSLSLERVLEELHFRNIRHIRLRPFLLVSGDHARNDLAGASPCSWRSRLETAGITAECDVRGLGEYESVARYFQEELTQL